jgi:phage shock protein B
MDPASVAALKALCGMLSTFVAVPVFAIILGVPAWVAVKIVKIRAGERLHRDDAAAMQAMSGRLQQMEQRMVFLEHILDSEAPGWRGEFGNGGQYGRQAG